MIRISVGKLLKSMLCGVMVANLTPLAACTTAWVALETDATPHRQEWTSVGPTPGEATIELTFAIKQQNTAELESRLLEASDPSNTAFYGKWMSNQEVHELLAPTRQDLAEVYGHLKRHGVTDGQLSHPTPNSDFIVARVTIAVAQRLLSARFTRYRHSATGFAVDRCTDSGYSLPARVAAAVDFVAPTVRLPPRGGRETGVSSGAGSLFKPASPQALVNNPKTLKQLYSVGSATGTGRGRNKAAVTAFLEQYYQEASLQEFYNLFCQDGVPCGLDGKADAVVTRGDAGDHPGSGTESMLDIEYITALGANIATEFWAFAGRSPDNSNNEPFLKWLTLLSNTSDASVPLLFSTSYGEDEDTVSKAWADRTNVEFQKAGVRGISLLYASGDSGAAGDNGCHDGKFVPQWPSGSPWVTAVGGTGPNGANSERAAGLSSGGFSNRWARPVWQTEAVAKYKSTAKLPNASKFNATGRGFPDISAQAENFVIVTNRIPLPGVAGTSCASPTAAGVIALLNDLRIAGGKPSLGFLNPFIYQNNAAWNDVTVGSSGGCGFDAGYPAAVGWDAATGVGTPNFDHLSKVIAGLP